MICARKSSLCACASAVGRARAAIEVDDDLATTVPLLVKFSDPSEASVLQEDPDDPDVALRFEAWEFAKEISAKVGAKPPIVGGTSIPEARAASAKTAAIEALPPGGVQVSNILAEYLGVAIQKNMDPDEAFDMAIDKIKKYTSY